MTYTTNIDIMNGEYYDSTIKNVKINTLFSDWLPNLIQDIIKQNPRLSRKKEFDLWWKVPGEQDAHITIKPDKNIRL